MSRSNGRPEPEVIMNFSDGYSYSKAKLDSACFAILENGPTKVSKDTKPASKKEDIDLIVNEFEISRARAERALAENDKDVVKTIHALINLQ
ncbi:hypothetical protein DFJ43DRAFT_658342 [Lentinula guzmanii]|uniref:Nascent polypeptide-associated complex subunit alpha-like UBA domain-containing protein n=2 Tax=Lentinula TaxID=5352 RepID=A0AA38J6D9_9AGAR|nr:hypothetical protein DFJ43DRAFT_658342 [Lentinula guzmanii]KAJ3795845.1 hypothetical protein GGU11DRAFT_687043 [Lentinula aff. detonsa]KAJ3984979.1 hypothetical protein F5890DRAFT_1513058 [Lentinula detonsa]